MTTYEFGSFAYCDAPIIMPTDTVFFRGIDVHVKELIQDRPMYVSTSHIASFYGNNVYAIKTTRPLRLADVRKLKHLLELLINSRKDNNKATLECVQSLTMSFGMCSYVEQVKLFSRYFNALKASNMVTDMNALNEVQNGINNLVKYYKDLGETPLHLNPVELQGVRIGETRNDLYSMFLLKHLFAGMYDGFIAPTMFSPFFVQTNLQMHEEIVIFDPIGVGLTSVPSVPSVPNDGGIITRPIQHLLRHNMVEMILSLQFENHEHMNMHLWKGGANKGSLPDKNTPQPDETKMNTKAKRATKQFLKPKIKPTIGGNGRKPNLSLHGEENSTIPINPWTFP